MFRGSHSTRVDDKGRLKLPAEFRKPFEEGQQFFITSEDGRRAAIYPIALWEMKEAELAKLPSMHPARRAYEDVTGLYGQMAEMDGQGRVVLPLMLREDARLTEEVRVLGKLSKVEPGWLEVVNFESFKQEIVKKPLTDDVRMQLAALDF